MRVRLSRRQWRPCRPCPLGQHHAVSQVSSRRFWWCHDRHIIVLFGANNIPESTYVLHFAILKYTLCSLPFRRRTGQRPCKSAQSEACMHAKAKRGIDEKDRQSQTDRNGRQRDRDKETDRDRDRDRDRQRGAHILADNTAESIETSLFCKELQTGTGKHGGGQDCLSGTGSSNRQIERAGTKYVSLLLSPQPAFPVFSGATSAFAISSLQCRARIKSRECWKCLPVCVHTHPDQCACLHV